MCAIRRHRNRKIAMHDSLRALPAPKMQGREASGIVEGQARRAGCHRRSDVEGSVENNNFDSIAGLCSGRMGHAQHKRIGGRKNAEHGGILNFERLGPQFAVAQFEARADIILPCVVGGEFACKPGERSSVRVSVPCIAAMAGLRNSMHRQASKRDYRVGPAAACCPACQRSAACRAAWRCAKNREQSHAARARS